MTSTDKNKMELKKVKAKHLKMYSLKGEKLDSDKTLFDYASINIDKE